MAGLEETGMKAFFADFQISYYEEKRRLQISHYDEKRRCLQISHYDEKRRCLQISHYDEKRRCLQISHYDEKRRCLQISQHEEEALSYMRAKNTNEKVMENFFAKLLARLNLLSKPMLLYNADKIGFSKVHKPRCKVLAQFEEKTVWGITSGERRRTHTHSWCVDPHPVMLFCP